MLPSHREGAVQGGYQVPGPTGADLPELPGLPHCGWLPVLEASYGAASQALSQTFPHCPEKTGSEGGGTCPGPTALSG